MEGNECRALLRDVRCCDEQYGLAFIFNFCYVFVCHLFHRPCAFNLHPKLLFVMLNLSLAAIFRFSTTTSTNHGIIYPGDVQWMTAASGIMHKEYHEKEFSRKGGVLHMIQLWVNLPKKDKMSAPGYQAITKEQMGREVLPDGKGTVTVVAGSFSGVKGPAKSFTPMNIYLIDLEKDGAAVLHEPGNFNMGMLVLGGEVKVNGENCKAKEFVLFKNEDGEVTVQAQSDAAKIFVLSGEPIDEPIAAGGPFVMNTVEELRQANEDFYRRKFGTDDF